MLLQFLITALLYLLASGKCLPYVVLGITLYINVYTVHANSEFLVAHSPRSLCFDGNRNLNSAHVDKVLLASMGQSSLYDVHWSGLKINNPFALPKTVIVLHVNGLAHISSDGEAKLYQLDGSSSDKALHSMAAALITQNKTVCDIDFEYFNVALQRFKRCFGSLPSLTMSEAKHLNPKNNSVDKSFLEAVAYINSAAANLQLLLSKQNLIIFRIDLGSLRQAYYDESAAMQEVKLLIGRTIMNLALNAQKTERLNTLVVAVSSDISTMPRMRRQVNLFRNNYANTSDINESNIYAYGPSAAVDTYFNFDQLTKTAVNPKIDDEEKGFMTITKGRNLEFGSMFNLILWSNLGLCFALTLICFVFYDMKPNKQNIVYRMVPPVHTGHLK